MYTVTVINGQERTVLHDMDPDSLQKLAACSFNEEVNVIPEMSFSIFPQNAGCEKLHPLTTLVEVCNTRTGENEFEGYLFKQTGSMKASGVIADKWSCEGYMGYLRDSVQDYHAYEETDVPDFLTALLANHNAMTEPAKHIYLGLCDIHDTSHKTTAYRNTFEEIKENLTSRLGGEIRVRKVDGRLYLDYVRQYGKKSTTRIELERNLQQIEVSTDVTHIITRLVPLGVQLNDETAERLTVASVNDGRIWIDDEDALAEYGTYRCAVQVWDDVTLPENLMKKGREYLKQNNVRKMHYRLTALDLSLIGLDVEGFTLGDTYETVNRLMHIDADLRVIRRNVNVCDPVRSTMDIGERTESFTLRASRAFHYAEYEAPKQKSEILKTAQNRASDMIKTATKGIIELDAENGELLLMTSADKFAETTRVWRFNTSGWGVSNNGYDGDYNMAATFDDGFVADFITAGTLTGIEIRNGNDTFHVTKEGEVTMSACHITGGSIHITTKSESYDVIELTCGNWQHTFSPLEWVLDNPGISCKVLCQAGCLYFFSGSGYGTGSAAATITAGGNAAFQSVYIAGNASVGGIGSFQAVTATGNISAGGTMSATGGITSGGDISTTGSISAGSTISAVDIYLNGTSVNLIVSDHEQAKQNHEKRIQALEAAVLR